MGCIWRLVIAMAMIISLSPQGFSTPPPVSIGLDADMSSGSARAGNAIRLGAQLAVDQINQAGGVLGHPLTLMVRDHRGNPARGIDNIKAFGDVPGLLAVLGGLHTPVALAELEIIHKEKIIYLAPWAAGTPVVDNGHDPNYVFRVSVRDEFAGDFLVKQVLAAGHTRPALLLEYTGWGRSNQKSMTRALGNRGLEPAGIFWFNWGAHSLTHQVSQAVDQGADVILLVSNAPEGVLAVRAVAQLPRDKRLPIFSHWGITGGDFFARARDWLPRVSLQFLQTHSFIRPRFPDRNRAVLTALQRRNPHIRGPGDISAPAGTAHAYDLVFLLKQAVERADSFDREAVRTALEHLPPYPGLVKTYAPAFTPDRHDALDPGDFTLSRFSPTGVILPIPHEEVGHDHP